VSIEKVWKLPLVCFAISIEYARDFLPGQAVPGLASSGLPQLAADEDRARDSQSEACLGYRVAGERGLAGAATLGATVRFLGAACELVGAAGCPEAAGALRAALVGARIGSRLIVLLLSSGGGSLVAARALAAVTTAWTATDLRNEILADGFWARWAQPVIDRAKLYDESSCDAMRELPTLGHVSSQSSLVLRGHAFNFPACRIHAPVIMCCLYAPSVVTIVYDLMH
jgi:hypothetical protein